jgi:hypothetical protein
VLRRTLQTTRGRLAVLVATVAFVMFSTAALLHFAFDQFDNYGEALWSAAVHLVDPGALIEDDGAAERAMGMFQAIAGLVLLIGLLFELISETVGRSIERLGRYDPPVHASGHLLIVGGGELLAEAAGALSLAAEVGERRERVVVLAPESSRQSRRRMLEELREQAAPAKLDLVFGDVADESGFELGGAARAATVLVLPSSSGPVIAEAADVEVTRIGLALEEYLAQRGAEPDVRLLFRRGRNVDAVWEMLPDGWDAIVGDRTVASVLRHALTGFGGLTELAELLDTRGSGNRELLDRERQRGEREGRPLRVTIVGCGINTPALLEDLAEAGAERFELTMLAARQPFETYLGRTDRAGVSLRFAETARDDPERLGEALTQSSPDIVLVTPSPLTWDLGDSDAEATLVLLHVLQVLGPDTPVLAELFLPESVERLPADPRLLPVSVLQSVSAAMALTVFNPERARDLSEALESEQHGRP